MCLFVCLSDYLFACAPIRCNDRLLVSFKRFNEMLGKCEVLSKVLDTNEEMRTKRLSNLF